jgi:putative AlgH/UPF0301 family transcriptional regulator
VLLAGWQWAVQEQEFRMFFGISHEKAMEMQEMGHPIELRAFAGYSGWGQGQLQSEIEDASWYTLPFEVGLLMEHHDPALMWRNLVRRFRAGVDVLLDWPEDPSLN